MKKSLVDFYTRLAHGIAAQFGSNCEVVVHDLQNHDYEHSIVTIVNGHVSGRQIGDAPSHIVLKSLQNGRKQLNDKLAYLTKTKDGKILKSSTIYIRDEDDEIVGILGINYDISLILAMEEQLHSLSGTETEPAQAEPISVNIGDLLDELIDQSLHSIGKPTTLMTKDDKVQVVKQLNEAGVFLITKSSVKVCEALGISKYTLYSYLDQIKSDNNS